MTTTFELKKKLRDVHCFLGVYPCDRLPTVKTFPASLIINTQPSDEPGEHWVAIHINKHRFGEYFDPYGFDPLNIEIEQFLGMYCSKGWTKSIHSIQGGLSIKCGEYCVLYVFLKSIGTDNCKIVQLFTTNHKVNDSIIKEMYKKL